MADSGKWLDLDQGWLLESNPTLTLTNLLFATTINHVLLANDPIVHNYQQNFTFVIHIAHLVDQVSGCKS